MPTKLPRHTITETPELSAALDAAARRWPEERSKTRLLALLADEGRRALDADAARRVRERRHQIRDLAGRLDDVYPADALDELRADWPT